MGYGRQVTGRVGTPADDTAKDFNVYRLRTSDAPYFGSGLEIAKVGRYLLARTQEHHLMEERAPVRVGDAGGVPQGSEGHPPPGATRRRRR